MSRLAIENRSIQTDNAHRSLGPRLISFGFASRPNSFLVAVVSNCAGKDACRNEI
jgi:hypothetical protein